MIWVVSTLLIVSVALNALLTVLVLTSSQRGMMYLDASHTRTTEYTKDLLDRLMVRDFREYRDTVEPPPVLDDEGFSGPELVPVIGPDRGGFGSRHGLRGWTEPDEEIKPEDDMP